MADSTIGFDFDSYARLCEVPAASDARHDEEFLLQGLRAGVNEAYETLIDRFEQPVYNLVYRLLDNPADANDVVQEVFVKVFRSVGSFQGKSSLKTWVYRIAFNEAYNQRRWFSRHKKQEIGLETESENSINFQEVLSDPGRSAFDIASDHETHEMIQEALAELNPSFRAVVVLRDIEDLSYEEIAEVLQVSLGTVKSRILRGREALRKALTGRLKPESASSWNTEPVKVK